MAEMVSNVKFGERAALCTVKFRPIRFATLKIRIKLVSMAPTQSSIV